VLAVTVVGYSAKSSDCLKRRCRRLHSLT